MAVSLVPFSSVTVLPRKSAGASLPQVLLSDWRYVGRRRTAAKQTVRTGTMQRQSYLLQES